MIKYYNEIEQCSLEWFNMRLGLITGSKLKDIIEAKDGTLKDDKNKNGTFKAKAPVLSAVSGIIAELCTGFSNDNEYQNEAMEWGTENEPVRIGEISNENSFVTGFVTNSRFKYFGLSPDLLEGKEDEAIKGTEIKCPTSKTFALWIIKNELPQDHKVQVMSYFVAIPTLQEMAFDVFDPRYLGTKKSHTITIKRADHLLYIANMEQALLDFEKLVDEKLELFK